MAPPPASTTATGAPEPEPSRHWTLLAGGDVLMDRTEAAGIDPFEFIEPSLASADIAVVNAEMAISDRGSPVDKEYVFRAPPQAAARIAAAGIDVANLANNHARDYGGDALLDSVRLLEVAGVVALGAGADDAEAYAPRVLLAAGDVRVAFVGASMVVPWGFPAEPDRPGIASARPTTRIVESVRAASAAGRRRDRGHPLGHRAADLSHVRAVRRDSRTAGRRRRRRHRPPPPRAAARRVRRRQTGRLLAGQLRLAPPIGAHRRDRRAADRLRRRPHRRLDIPPAPARRERRPAPRHRGAPDRPDPRHHRPRLRPAHAAPDDDGSADDRRRRARTRRAGTRHRSRGDRTRAGSTPAGRSPARRTRAGRGPADPTPAG